MVVWTDHREGTATHMRTTFFPPFNLTPLVPTWGWRDGLGKSDDIGHGNSSGVVDPSLALPMLANRRPNHVELIVQARGQKRLFGSGGQRDLSHSRAAVFSQHVAAQESYYSS
jgi:hypothetical protein